ncbi:MAG: tRNA (adenosine(37)-N6)-threonylcarbamoyltransferase complex ATPase subunit type 1 TsaE [Actinobacteria bacterium]|nr:tRNA (adenosine(37)-N6)-threonylcarbamoyltransferase complex ATPase subunit type 1 TsaE [Actinomycetota bacterium]
MRVQLRAPTADDTRAIGEAIAPLVATGDAFALTGELGAGKTTFVQGLAHGLGFDGRVVSPTFTLVRFYPTGRLPITHADVYRLDRVQDVVDLGLEDGVEDGVLLVEWGDAVEGLLPDAHLVVELTVPGGDEERAVAIWPAGDAWRLRWERLERALDRWSAAS